MILCCTDSDYLASDWINIYNSAWLRSASGSSHRTLHLCCVFSQPQIYIFDGLVGCHFSCVPTHFSEESQNTCSPSFWQCVTISAEARCTSTGNDRKWLRLWWQVDLKELEDGSRSLSMWSYCHLKAMFILTAFVNKHGAHELWKKDRKNSGKVSQPHFCFMFSVCIFSEIKQ